MLALSTFTGSVAHSPVPRRATGAIHAGAWPYLSGSAIALGITGFPGPYGHAVVGPGAVVGATYHIPVNAVPGAATLIAGSAAGLAVRTIRIVNPPSVRQSVVAIACYDDGIVFHDAKRFTALGLLATGGAPSDAAFDAVGHILATDTQGTAATLVTLSPWNVARFKGIPLGDEVAPDDASGAFFVTDRDVEGSGALTRVGRHGALVRVATGETAEGLAIDERRQIVYVANVNSDSVTAVDARTMRVLRRFHAVARVFSLALSADGRRLYAVSNQSAGSPFAAPGRVVAIALTGAHPHVVARSRPLAFPLGIALDSRRQTLFVTDEERDVVDVLDARTLRAKHAPLRTCRTPWKPTFDAVTGRLYIPCARANAVDVFQSQTLRRVPGAPFATGGYPLAVSIWHPR